MLTEYYKIDRHNIDETVIEKCANLIRQGKLVAFPTETVYGLGANALDKKAIHCIFKAKGRPNDNPLILHVASMDMAKRYCKDIPQIAYTLAENFWPGPLTMIFKKREIVPMEATANLETVAIRVPSHPVALSLITKSNCPIAAPSANSSGRPSTTDGMHVLEDLDGKVDAIIDCGSSDIGLESTVIDLSSDQAAILRPGGITYLQLKKYLPDLIEQSKLKEKSIPKSPGMKYKHYAPKAPVYLVRGSKIDVVKKINELSDDTTGILCISEHVNNYTKGHVVSLGSIHNPKEIANRLFANLRNFDKSNVTKIYCEYFDFGELNEAIMNRLKKAADNKIIQI